MAQNLAQDEAGNIWEVDAQGNAVRLVQQGGAPQSTVVAPNPVRVQREQDAIARQAAADRRAAEAAARAATTFAERNAPQAPSGYRFNAAGGLEPIPGGPADKSSGSQQGNPEMTAASRANAINAFTATRQLDSLIKDIESQYRAGPGATKGIAGAQDWLPTPTNRRFDAAGNAVRGAAITALGFTSGQTNSPKEVEMNIGPYIPAAGDYDEVIQDKISRLKELRDRARVQAVTVLGGVPSADGRVTPLSNLPANERNRLFPVGTMQPTSSDRPEEALALSGGHNGGQPPSPPSMPGGSTPGAPMGGDPGSTLRFAGDAEAPATGLRLTGEQQANIMGAIRSGDEGQALSLFERYTGIAPGPDTAQGVRSAIAAVRANPNAQISLNYGAVDAAAQAQHDQERYGNFLPEAISQVEQGSGLASLSRGALNGLTLGAAPYIAAGANSLISDRPFSQQLQYTRARDEADQRVNPWWRLGGEVVGGAATAGGLEMGLAKAGARLPGIAGSVVSSPRTADAVFGVTSAAIGSGGDAGQTALGGGAGVVGGMFGRGLTRGIGNAFTGVRNASAQALRQAGVPLTAGQALGGVVKGVEDRLSGVPVIGNVINNRRLEGLEAFNRTAFDEALAPVGLNTGGAIREQGVDAARAARSQAYGNALDGVRVQADAPFVSDMQAAINAGRALPDPMSGRLDYTLPTRVGNSFGPNGELTGRDFQQSLRGLRRDAKSVENEAYGWDFGNVTRQAEGALEGLLQRQAPGVVEAYGAANAANRNVEIVRDAVNRARNGSRSGETGVFTPSQLADAAAQNSRRFGGTQGTTQQPFFALSRAGQEVLPNQVPDSGTAGRLAMLALPAALGGGGAGVGAAGGDAQSGAATGLALGALLTAGGSRASQQAITRMLLDRPDALRALGGQINNRARIGGMFGAPLLVAPFGSGM